MPLLQISEKNQAHFPADGFIQAPSAACLISTRVRHRVTTVTVRNAILVWVRKGRKFLTQANANFEFNAGEAMLLAQGSQWDVVNDVVPHGEYEALVLQFGTEVLNRFDAQYRAEFFSGRVRHCTKFAIDAQFERSIQHAAEGFQSLASERIKLHRILEVLLLLAERGYLLSSEKDLSWPDKVRRLVSQRPHFEWSLMDIADYFHISESTLRRRLAKFDATAGDLIRETRLEAAMSLLQSTQLPVGEVAQRCGYESHSRFSAAFRARYGYPPSYLRLQI